LRAQGIQTAQALARELNDEGVPSVLGKGPVAEQQRPRPAVDTPTRSRVVRANLSSGAT
jgi:hypothetical protein